MKVLHAIIALLFIFVGLSLYTTTSETISALLALLISNVSLAAISIENALDKAPIEPNPADREGR
jgi:hypothetical protein